MQDKYQNSVCNEFSGILHKYDRIYDIKYGVVEQCAHCGERMFFAWDVDNTYYLSFHIRSSLQMNDAVFHQNYPNFNLI